MPKRNTVTQNTVTTDVMKEENNMTTTTIDSILAETKAPIAEKATRVRTALCEAAAYKAALKSCPIDGAELREAVSSFLLSIADDEVAMGADVILVKNLDTTVYPASVVTDKVAMAWSYNPKAAEGRRKKALWLHIVPVAKQEKSMADKALSFFANRLPEVPEQLISELFDATFDGSECTFCVHGNAKPVAVASKERPGGRFMLQEVDENGTFIPNRPIAYVVGNRAYVSIPGVKAGRPWRFLANPPKRVREE